MIYQACGCLKVRFLIFNLYIFFLIALFLLLFPTVITLLILFLASPSAVASFKRSSPVSLYLLSKTYLPTYPHHVISSSNTPFINILNNFWSFFLPVRCLWLRLQFHRHSFPFPTTIFPYLFNRNKLNFLP